MVWNLHKMYRRPFTCSVTHWNALELATQPRGALLWDELSHFIRSVYHCVTCLKPAFEPFRAYPIHLLPDWGTRSLHWLASACDTDPMLYALGCPKWQPIASSRAMEGLDGLMDDHDKSAWVLFERVRNLCLPHWHVIFGDEFIFQLWSVYEWMVLCQMPGEHFQEDYQAVWV